MTAFSRKSSSRKLGLGAACVAGLVATSAQGAVISSGVVDIDVFEGSNLNIDVDGDTVDDYFFTAITQGKGGGTIVTIQPFDQSFPGTDLYAFDAGGNFDQLSANDAIDGSLNFVFSPGDFTSSNQWSVGDRGFVGLSLEISGATHYGWIDVTHTTSSTVTVHQWAYEDVAGASISAGDTGAAVPATGTAGLFAGLLGAFFSRFRRRKP